MSGECPTCGPTTAEQHPRQPAVTRCGNCKEWLRDRTFLLPDDCGCLPPYADCTHGPAEVEGECGSCGESPEDDCPKSKRPCGHHCNHVWTHDACDWCGKEFTPTPVSSEVAETTAGEREVEALAYLFGEHASIGSDERKIGDEWVWGFDCECGEFTPDTEVNEHLARAVLASPALAALLDRVRREEGDRIAQAIEAGVLSSHPSDHYKDGFRRAAQIAREGR